MARRRKSTKSRKHRKAMGSTRRGSKLRGLGAMMKMGSTSNWLPAAVGGIGSVAITLGIRSALSAGGTVPITDLGQKAYRYAPLIGMIGGALVLGGGVYFLAGKAPATAAAAVAALVGGSMFVGERLMSSTTGAASVIQGPAVASGAVAGLRAVTAQYPSLPRRRGVGAIVMEDLGANEQNQGETVNLRGGRSSLRGIVQTRAFGTPPFGG